MLLLGVLVIIVKGMPTAPHRMSPFSSNASSDSGIFFKWPPSSYPEARCLETGLCFIWDSSMGGLEAAGEALGDGIVKP